VTESQTSIPLEADGDGFLLRLVENGQNVALLLTADNVLALGQAALSYQQYIMARSHPGAVYAAPVEPIGVAWSALGEEILVSVCSEPEPAVAGMIATWSWIEGGAREGDKPSRDRRQEHRGHALWALPFVPPRHLPAHGMRLAMSTCS
jgi:hypothetical protein